MYMWDILVYNKILSSKPMSLFWNNYASGIDDGWMMTLWTQTLILKSLHDRTKSALYISISTDGGRIISVILGKD